MEFTYRDYLAAALVRGLKSLGENNPDMKERFDNSFSVKPDWSIHLQDKINNTKYKVTFEVIQ